VNKNFPFDLAAEVKETILSVTRAMSAPYLDDVISAANAMVAAIEAGGKLLIMGNGGSAADAQHIAAELIGRFKAERRALPAIALTTDSSIITAWSNDYSYDTVFSRQVEGLARPGDVVWGISTSGNSENVVRAFECARSMGVTTVGLLGRDGGRIAPLCDYPMIVKLIATDQVQTAHLLTYHSICARLDEAFKHAHA
jgi:D-sedoheptulose 7-phosphate isomerase